MTWHGESGNLLLGKRIGFQILSVGSRTSQTSPRISRDQIRERSVKSAPQRPPQRLTADTIAQHYLHHPSPTHRHVIITSVNVIREKSCQLYLSLPPDPLWCEQLNYHSPPSKPSPLSRIVSLHRPPLQSGHLLRHYTTPLCDMNMYRIAWFWRFDIVTVGVGGLGVGHHTSPLPTSQLVSDSRGGGD